jgi:hypothetical protein
VPNWVLNFDLVKNGAIVQLYKQCISDRTFVRFVIFLTEALVLDAVNLSTECVDARVGSRFICAVQVVSTERSEVRKRGGLALRIEVSVDEGISDHVADCVAVRTKVLVLSRTGCPREKSVLAVGEVCEWALLVDNADGSLLGADAHALDIIRRLTESGELPVNDVGSLDGRLRVELGGIRYFKQHVLHHVGTKRTLKLEPLAPEQDVVEAPRLGGQHGRQAGLTPLDEVSQIDGARARVAGSPRLARARVRRVAVGAKRLAIHPGLRDGVDGLVARKAAGNKDVASIISRTSGARGGTKPQRGRGSTYRSLDTTAVDATLTRTTWSRPTRLNELSRARPPWISCALIMPSRMSLTVTC